MFSAYRTSGRDLLMIRLYRSIRYPDRTLFTFQGDGGDVAALERILQTRPERSTLSFGAETGYYANLREPERAVRERQATDYLATHYIPPLVRLSWYRARQPLPLDEPPDKVRSELRAAIRDYFSAQGHLALPGPVVYWKQRHSIAPGLEALDGIAYRLVGEAGRPPILQLDARYQFQMNGCSVDVETVRMQYAHDGQTLAKLKRFVSRDTRTLFDTFNDFVSSLRRVPALAAYGFQPPALSATDADLETWVWAHDSPFDFEVGGGLSASLAQFVSKYRLGMYRPGEIPLVVLLYPAAAAQRWCGISDWSSAKRRLQASLASIRSQAGVPAVQPVEYTLMDDADVPRVVDCCRMIVERYPQLTPMFLLIGAPEESRRAADEELVAYHGRAYRLTRELRKLQRGAYTTTIGWDAAAQASDQQYALESALLKGLIAQGAVPWRLQGLACPTDGSVENLALIGLESWRSRDSVVIGGVIFDSHGIPIGYHCVRCREPSAGVDMESLLWLLNRLLAYCMRVTNRAPGHAVIHVDGKPGVWPVNRLSAIEISGFALDVVSIALSGGPRLMQLDNDAATPSRDLAVGSEVTGTAYLNNTLVFCEKLHDHTSVWPAPDSLVVRRLVGHTPIKVLAAQVHAFSRAYYGSYFRTDSRPATLVYAKALLAHDGRHLDQRDRGSPIDATTHLRWL
jgi:hypothetical protein